MRRVRWWDMSQDRYKTVSSKTYFMALAGLCSVMVHSLLDGLKIPKGMGSLKFSKQMATLKRVCGKMVCPKEVTKSKVIME